MYRFLPIALLTAGLFTAGLTAPAHAAGSSYAYTVDNFDADIELARRNLDRYWQFRIPNRVTYTAPGVSWLNELGGTATACGDVEANEAPTEAAFYCADEKVLYLDYAFLRYINRNYGYDGLMQVMAHEYGHHVQNLAGLQNPNVKTDEWQADCYAGAAMRWLSRAFTLLSRADQASMAYDSGDSDPGPKSHGSGLQRMRWFLVGWDANDPAPCRFTY